jgi:antitoxin component YwqK of YwqJK toxin-antitoxin module
MNPRILTFFLFVFVHNLTFCQTDKLINQNDNLGRKQGHWIKKYDNGNIMYDGFFKDNYPTGEFKRYYENNTLKSLLVFSGNGKEAKATLYYPNGLKASEGKYINQLKTGKWKFFSSITEGCFISEEEYSGGKKQGLSVKFYPDSTVAEKLSYSADIKNGEWLKYHPNGSLHLRTGFNYGKLNGRFEAFFDDGKPEVTGQYKDDLKDGLWIIYKKDGNIKFKTEYKSGLAQNHNIDIYESDYIDSLEKKKVKIADPEKTGEIW